MPLTIITNCCYTPHRVCCILNEVDRVSKKRTKFPVDHGRDECVIPLFQFHFNLLFPPPDFSILHSLLLFKHPFILLDTLTIE